MLSLELQRPVLDKTGLKGTYDFSLRWTSAASQSVEHGPSILAAVQEQLGLKLLPSNEQTAPVQVLVVDHAERVTRSEEHTSELQSRLHLVCRLLLEKKN